MSPLDHRRTLLLFVPSAALLVSVLVTPRPEEAEDLRAGAVATPVPTPAPVPVPEASPAPMPPPAPAPTAVPAEEQASQIAEEAAAEAQIREVTAAQWGEIVEVGAWRPGCPVGRGELRRVEVNHWDFDGEVRRGVLVVHADVAESVARIFTRLFDAEFPIRRMEPIEVYGGDDLASEQADNTSAFNCRSSEQANAPAALSPHANGRAIDVNPLENPWRNPRCDCWEPSDEHAERVEGKGMILEGGVVWRAFTEEGWIWQNIDVADYMHFDTGYPSEPFIGAPSGPEGAGSLPRPVPR